MGIPEPELHLLLHRDSTQDWPRWRAAAIGSVGAHIAAVAALLLFKGEPVTPRAEPERKQIVTHLYTPPELTQKAPNKGPISKELIAEAVAPRQILRAPAPAPAARAATQPPPPQPRPPQPRQAPAPPVQAQNTPKPTVPDPPKIESQAPAGQSTLAQINPLQTVEKPKLVLENAAPPPPPRAAARPAGALAPQSNTLQDMIRDMAKGTAHSGMAVGDIGSDPGSIGPGLNLPPSSGRPRSSLELKSDPMGVDFRPYLLQALQAVRRNWFAVYPEAARLGQRGQVVLQFAIIRQGTVTKVVYTTESGSRALDQAAVAAVSASNPLPPLPADFKGDRIVLQMTFLYNMQR